MFLTRSGLKKLMRIAYKGGGLRVRRNNGGLSISGACWTVYFLWGKWPKETMGDLISLVGVLPEQGEQYLATKEGNQMEILDDAMMDAMEIAEQGNYELYISPVILEDFPKHYRMMRNPDTGKIVCIREDYYECVDLDQVDTNDDEMLPEGPMIGRGSILGQYVDMVSWSNNRMAFAVIPERTQNPEIIRICKDFENAMTQRIELEKGL